MNPIPTKPRMLLLGLVVALASLYLIRNDRHRPKYIFLNTTGHHEHDLSLKMSLKLAEKRSGIENALILLKELPERKSIEQVASEFFLKYRIGADRNGKGILYLYSEKENLVKIEVSYALEATIPDAICRRLEEAGRTYMLSEVPQDYWSELLITLNLESQNRFKQWGEHSRDQDWMKVAFLSGGAGTRSRGYERSREEFQKVIQNLPKGHDQDYLPGEAIESTLKRYLSSIEKGIGNPNVPLLTEGSRFFRMVIPRNEAQQKRIFSYYERGMPYRILENESTALVVFARGVPNLPIVLRKGGSGLWYIDEARSWAWFQRFEDGNDFYPKYANIPGLGDQVQSIGQHPTRAIFRDQVGVPDLKIDPEGLSTALPEYEMRAMTNSASASAQARLAEVYFFEMGWSSKAIYYFEKAQRLDPGNPEYHWRLYDLYMNNSQADLALRELKVLAETLPALLWLKAWYQQYEQFYRLKEGEFE